MPLLKRGGRLLLGAFALIILYESHDQTDTKRSATETRAQIRFSSRIYFDCESARFGAIEKEIADELHINHATLDNWKKKYPEFLGALKAGKDAFDDRVERSLYQRASGWGNLPPDVTACIFWLKNRCKEQWRDVQNVAAALGHYVISERPLTEEEWAAERAQIVDADSRTLATEAETDTDNTNTRRR